MRNLNNNGYVSGNNATIVIMDDVKYKESAKEFKEVRYTNVKAFEVVSGEKAKEIEAHTDGSCIDEYHEYLVLYFEDGNTSTFRNSHVDMFAI